MTSQATTTLAVDADRERIVQRAKMARAIIDDLTEAAHTASSRHDHAVLLERQDTAQMEREFLAIERACQLAGMVPTTERADMPAWLAANLKGRPGKVATDDAVVDEDGSFVITRNDAHGRRFWGPGTVAEGPLWTTLVGAFVYANRGAAERRKPRGSKVITSAEAAALVEQDASAPAESEGVKP